ncbi:protein jag [Fannyhessea vaginae]|uniref:Jag family protein n=1 Tax=Fannyhessea vaginae TaxID=82135 RepID=UPI003A808A7B
MSTESQFMPDSFDSLDESDSQVNRSDSMFKDTKASLDAFLAQQRADGFFSEITSTSNQEYKPSKEDKKPVQREFSSSAPKDQHIRDEHIETEYVPSDNPVINAIHDHMVAREALSEEEKDFIASIVVTHLKSILGFFGETSVSIDEYESETNSLIFDISGGDLAVLIGRHGFTLEALQTIINAFVSNELHFYYPVTIDVEEYKVRRKKKVEAIALAAAARARNRHGKVSLAPMSPAERRLVHITLLGDSSVATHSEGVEPHRRVVVTYVRKNRQR